MGLDNPLHIAFLVVILLLLFGAKRLPEIGRQLGSGMREFKQSVTGQGEPERPALSASQQAQAPAPAAQAAQAPVAPVTQAGVAAPEPATVAPGPAQPPAAEPTQQT
ncbi:MAG TPA: twin-arginine translocase TatA/TatE family subunit [Solirubrobacteraceae bacterium]|nr:twin-arginine translocase TatA/TatE family subunit [Solirubrobacteraceae bacterium]